MQGFITEMWSYTQAGSIANKYDIGKIQSNPRAIIQMRFEQNLNGKTRVNPDIGPRMRTRDNKLENMEGFRSVAITGRAINARQYRN